MAQYIYEVITDADVKSAFDRIAEKGKEYGKHRILHIDQAAKATKRFVKHSGKRFSIREVLRVSSLFHFDVELGDTPDTTKKVREITEKQGFKKTKPVPRFLLGKMGLQKENFVRMDASGREHIIGEKEMDEDDDYEGAVNAEREYGKREIEKISRKHVEQACDFIRRNGKCTEYDIWRHEHYSADVLYFIRDKEGNKYAQAQAAKLSYLFALQDAGETSEKPPFPETKRKDGVRETLKLLSGTHAFMLWTKLGMEFSNAKVEMREIEQKNKHIELLRQSRQIIFYGPPGTGKTRYARNLLPDLLIMGRDEIKTMQGDRWDIVQFHPSYNYEDFVRGVKVETQDGAAVYTTENRVFGEMCRRAEAKSGENYALIIDEINRANASSVFGELIYALEYRGEKIKTPYAVKGNPMLTIPNNLYVIGTMNTADRTIGQIDYAVRRRFAFIDCLPKEDVIPEGAGKDFFRDVEEIFKQNISQDYDADDVRIGHSYFLKTGEELANRIIYQVVPILREYVKDGVLSKDAEKSINEIKRKAEEFANDGGDAGNFEEEEEKAVTSQRTNTGGRRGKWAFSDENIGGAEYVGMPLKNVVIRIVRLYVGRNPGITIEELRDWHPDKRTGKNAGIQRLSDIEEKNMWRFFHKDNELLKINGVSYCVSNQWGEGIPGGRGIPDIWKHFVNEVAKSGYKVYEVDSAKGVVER